MRVDQAQVEGSQSRVAISDRNEQGAIDGWVTLVGLQARLNRISTAGTGAIPITSAVDDTQRGVCHVELRDPGNVFCSLCLSSSDVAVVGTDFLACSLPLQSHLATGERKSTDITGHIGAGVGSRARTRAGGLDDIGAGADSVVEASAVGTAVASRGNTRLVEDSQRREVLPHQTGLIARAGADIWRQESPGPGLWDTDFEPLGHGEETLELAEDQLLARIGRGGQRQQISCLSGVEVRQEAIYTSLAGPSQLLAEVEEFIDIGIWIVVRALLRRFSTEYVAD